MGGGDRRWSVVLRTGLFFATLAALAAALAAAVAAAPYVHSNSQPESCDHRARRKCHLHMELRRPPADTRRDLTHRRLR